MRIKIFIANKIHDVKGGCGPALSVIMMLIINDVNFPRIVWTCPLTHFKFEAGGCD